MALIPVYSLISQGERAERLDIGGLDPALVNGYLILSADSLRDLLGGHGTEQLAALPGFCDNFDTLAIQLGLCIIRVILLHLHTVLGGGPARF